MTAFIFFPWVFRVFSHQSLLIGSSLLSHQWKRAVTSFTSDLWTKPCSHWKVDYTLALHSWPVGNRGSGKSGILPWVLLVLSHTRKGRYLWYVKMAHRRTFCNPMFLWLFQPQPIKWIINYILCFKNTINSQGNKNLNKLNYIAYLWCFLFVLWGQLSKIFLLCHKTWSSNL